jgi:hypothetical protein
MNYLYRTNMEKKEDTLGKGTWPYLKKKLTVLIVGDVLVIEGETKKELQRVRRDRLDVADRRARHQSDHLRYEELKMDWVLATIVIMLVLLGMGWVGAMRNKGD